MSKDHFAAINLISHIVVAAVGFSSGNIYQKAYGSKQEDSNMPNSNIRSNVYHGHSGYDGDILIGG